jgi:hypothetical protein
VRPFTEPTIVRQVPAGSSESRPFTGESPRTGGGSRRAETRPQGALGRLNLDVLVYAETAAQRMVFINGRRYVEGDLIAGLVRIEAIVPEGAMLVYEDQRLLLRPKANLELPPVK